MGLSKLTRERPTKRARATSAAGYGSSSSGKPGALTGVSSSEPALTAQDVEMTALDAAETPEATMSSPELGGLGLDEWIHLPPPTSTPDDEMRSPSDEDVDMEETFWDGDEVMEEVREKDVAMEGIT